MKQRTLKKSYIFTGKGLHTGKVATMTVNPAPADTGIRFRRTDLGESAFIDALAENISSTARSTTLSCGEASVSTVEHIMSALTGLGIDNALIEIDNVEVPILDGSARLYVEAMAPDGFVEQDAERKWVELPEEVSVRDEQTGSEVRLVPASEIGYDLRIEFKSETIGVQDCHWDLSTDYANQIAPCRTFVFFDEIAYLAEHNLVKGGDIDNAIVVVDHPVSDEQVRKISGLFGMDGIKMSDSGYLTNIDLHFPDECARHKMLDLIGDMRLCGGFVKAYVIAYKSGHPINSRASKAVRELLQKTKK